MSSEISPSTGKSYGVKRVCDIWEEARSTFYARKNRLDDPENRTMEKRGPKTDLSDEQLLEEIRADLAASPFRGEGHKKVTARLRVQRQLKVSAKRILRLMRQANLLSPHRSRRGMASVHDGRIGTDAPNVMWGTDGTKLMTVEDGNIWIFAAVEHWNTECVGWHACKEGTRFNALQPLAMGLQKLFGSTGADAGRGLSVRMDHGSQYVSEHFRGQLKHWGIATSYAFISEPETNGVAERFFRTLKEQVIYGRIFRNIEEVRLAVSAFVKQYNAWWLVEKRGYLSPNQAREKWLADHAA